MKPSIDPAAAHAALFASLGKAPLPDTLEPYGLSALLTIAIAGDIEYIDSLTAADGSPRPYDDDDAFEAIADPIVRAFSLEGEAEQDACEWVDQYMEAMADYLEEMGLVDWM